MASIIIDDLDEGLVGRLRDQALRHGCSIEDEVKAILDNALDSSPPPALGVGSAIHARFKALGGVELEPLPREPIREPPSFD